MLNDEDRRKILEGVMTSKEYKDAKNMMGVLKASQSFLESLATNIRFRDEYNSTKDYFYKVYESFKKVIKDYQKGDLFGALTQLKLILVDDTGRMKLSRFTLKTNTPLFRMRGQKAYKLYERKEMFHIPTDKANVVANVRYSINGFPCLYLGASLYVCWEETRRSDIDHVNYVKMMPTKDIEFVTTLCPEEFKTEDDVIRFFVFALCTKVADNDNDKFQFQYAFPELVLHLFVNCMLGTDEAWGIKYVSARYFDNDGKISSEPLFYNYVLPIRGDMDENDYLSSELKECFKVSDVKAFYVHRIYEQMPTASSTRPNEYSNTHFMLLEKELKAKKTLNGIPSI